MAASLCRPETTPSAPPRSCSQTYHMTYLLTWDNDGQEVGIYIRLHHAAFELMDEATKRVTTAAPHERHEHRQENWASLIPGENAAFSNSALSCYMHFVTWRPCKCIVSHCARCSN